MKTWSMLMAVLVLGFSASLVLAEGAEHKANRKGGEITKIDGANITIQPKAMGEGKDKPAAVTFATDDKTVVTKNGEKKAVSDLAVGDKVAVVLSDDGKTAISISSGKKPEVKKEGAHK